MTNTLVWPIFFSLGPVRSEWNNANAVYHVTTRRSRRKAVFTGDADRPWFLETSKEPLKRFGPRVHAHCSIPDRYHLLLETPRANLSTSIGWLETTYNIRLNRRPNRSGHLLQGPLKVHPLDKVAYVRELINYVHLNQLLPRDKRKPVPTEGKTELRSYGGTSHRAYARLERGDSRPCLSLEYLSYFASTRGLERAECRREIDEIFRKVIRTPWHELRHGLLLRGDVFWRRPWEIMNKPERPAETRWWQRLQTDDVFRVIASLAAEEVDRRTPIWLRVQLGGGRMMTVAAEYRYHDRTRVYQVVQRLEEAFSPAATSEGSAGGRIECQELTPFLRDEPKR